MEIVNPNVRMLANRYKEISLLNQIKDTLDWDQETYLPEQAEENRGSQMGLMASLITDRWKEPVFQSKLGKAQKASGLNNEERAVVRNLTREARRFQRVPKDIIVESDTTASVAYGVWDRARKANSFAAFEPSLSNLVRLARVEAGYLGNYANAYDAHLDRFEPGLTANHCRELFGEIRPFLTELLYEIRSTPGYFVSHVMFEGGLIYPVRAQQQIVYETASLMGYDLARGRVDVSPHPFTVVLGGSDVRTTTHYKDDDFRESFSSATHEFGHALYYQGVKEEYYGTPLEGSSSTGISEAISRIWENQIGRDPRLLEYLEPGFRAHYPEQLIGVSSPEFVRAFNTVRSSLIRIEADEVTYNLHVILRFEIEDDLINGRLQPGDVPEVWNRKMREYLGVEPKNDYEGALQDSHWSYGYFGYFPSYALGNLYAGQLWVKMAEDVDLDTQLKTGQLKPINDWLKEKVYQHGSLYTPTELIEKATGEKLNPKYFLDYLKDKYQKIYQIS